ncbi:hypothetical protein JCM10212_005929 [Sporobolomyces blumeae]
MSSTSDDDLDTFFRRTRGANHESGATRQRRGGPRSDQSKRRDRTTIESDPDCDAGSGTGLDGGDREGSSDVEIVRTEKPTKSSVTDRGDPRNSKTTTTAATSTSRSRKARSTVHVLSESESESDLDPVADIGISSTQLDRNGDRLREMARESGRWRGETPPERVRKRKEQEEQAQRSRQGRGGVDDEADSPGSEAASRKSRRTSNSTAATSLSSDKDPSIVKKRTSAARAPAATKTATRKATKPTSTSTRKRRAASPSRSPSPHFVADVVPPPPVSFWGLDETDGPNTTVAGGKRPAAPAKAKPGEKSQRLKTLSEQTKKILDLGDQGDHGEDEIVASSSSGDEENQRYEPVAKKAERERREGIAKLRARRNGQNPPPFRPVTNAISNAHSPRSAKGKQRAVDSKPCPVCNDPVPVDSYDVHLNECISAEDLETQFQVSPARPSRTRNSDCPASASSSNARPGPATAARGGFRAAGTASATRNAQASGSGSGSGTGTEVREATGRNLAAELFPSQEEGDGSIERNRPAPSRSSARTSNAPSYASSNARKNGKGKEKAVLVQDSDDGFDEHEGFLDDDEFGDEDWEMYEQANGGGGSGPRGGGGGAHLHKTVINIDDDDDDDLIIEDGGATGGHAGAMRTGRGGGNGGASGSRGRASGPIRGGRDGAVGAVNAKRVPGPPQNGSSPPRGSLYLSTMSRAYKEGYERMYSRASGHKNVEAAEEVAASFDALAPQKMTTATGPGSRGGRGGGRRRGGFRGRGRWKKKG